MKKEQLNSKIIKKIKEAEKRIKKGEYYTEEEALKELGL